VDIDFGIEDPFQKSRITETEYVTEQAKLFADSLNDEYLPGLIVCEFCDSEIKLSETERQNKYFKCSSCKNEKNVREKERALENEFKNKPDVELFEIIVEPQNFRIEFVLAAKSEIIKRDIQLPDNEEFLAKLKDNL
jgi:hypothetical protein